MNAATISFSPPCSKNAVTHLQYYTTLRAWRPKEESRIHCSHQALLHGVARSSTARGDLDLAIDRGQVSIDGARTDDEVVSYLCIGQSLCEQAQHLDFTRGQAIGVGSWRLHGEG